MDYDTYAEVINGENTYRKIAYDLLNGEATGIGWTDEKKIHLDIIFKLGIENKAGMFQRRIKQNDLFVSIIGHTSYGFVPGSIKEGTYIQEKLGIYDECGDKLAELINGVIKVLNESGNSNG